MQGLNYRERYHTRELMSFHFIFVTNFIHDKNPLYGILCSCQYGGVFQSRIHCIRIQRLLGCMVCCSWNNTTLSTRKVSSLKERSSQISAKCRTIHKIFHCAFSYPCLLISRRFLIRASHHCPFVYNGFYHWLYIIINSINL